jgi:hypothetical protein
LGLRLNADGTLMAYPLSDQNSPNGLSLVFTIDWVPVNVRVEISEPWVSVSFSVQS